MDLADEVELRLLERRFELAEAEAPPAIPRRTIEALTRYAVRRIPTGGFLRAVLEDKLLSAIQAADNENLAAFVPIVQYCFKHLPAACWGSPQAVRAWIKSKGEGKDT